MKKLNAYIADELLGNLDLKPADQEVIQNAKLYMDASDPSATSANLKQISNALNKLRSSFISSANGFDVINRMQAS